VDIIAGFAASAKQTRNSAAKDTPPISAKRVPSGATNRPMFAWNPFQDNRGWLCTVFAATQKDIC